MLRVAPMIFPVEPLPMAFNNVQNPHLQTYDLREAYFEASTETRDDLHYLRMKRLSHFLSEAGGGVPASKAVDVDLPRVLAYFPRLDLQSVADTETGSTSSRGGITRRASGRPTGPTTKQPLSSW